MQPPVFLRSFVQFSHAGFSFFYGSLIGIPTLNPLTMLLVGTGGALRQKTRCNLFPNRPSRKTWYEHMQQYEYVVETCCARAVRLFALLSFREQSCRAAMTTCVTVLFPSALLMGHCEGWTLARGGHHGNIHLAQELLACYQQHHCTRYVRILYQSASAVPCSIHVVLPRTRSTRPRSAKKVTLFQRARSRIHEPTRLFLSYNK